MVKIFSYLVLMYFIRNIQHIILYIYCFLELNSSHSNSLFYIKFGIVIIFCRDLFTIRKSCFRLYHYKSNAANNNARNKNSNQVKSEVINRVRSKASKRAKNKAGNGARSRAGKKARSTANRQRKIISLITSIRIINIGTSRLHKLIKTSNNKKLANTHRNHYKRRFFENLL